MASPFHLLSCLGSALGSGAPFRLKAASLAPPLLWKFEAEMWVFCTLLGLRMWGGASSITMSQVSPGHSLVTGCLSGFPHGNLRLHHSLWPALGFRTIPVCYQPEFPPVSARLPFWLTSDPETLPFPKLASCPKFLLWGHLSQA